MTYGLGIDLGTTYTAAAVARGTSAEIFQLGDRAASVPSVVLLREDGSILVGDAANRRAVSEPGRVAREFKRRLGDTTPLFLGGAPWSAEALMGRLLSWVVGQVIAREGSAPERVALTRPANWGGFKLELLENAARMADLDQDVLLISEPEAAALHYASTERVEPGEVIAVYDLGGGTFDATVLRRTEQGFELIGSPEGIERLGGIDFDAAVFQHVQRSLGGLFDELDDTDPAVLSAVARIRADCQDAKEGLSSDTDAVIPVLLPSAQTEVRITRDEFEAMIRPTLTETLGAMRRALRSAELEPDQVSRVLLVGGSSRIPLVSELVSSELGRPVAVDAHPKHAVALGAALAAAGAVDLGAAPVVPAHGGGGGAVAAGGLVAGAAGAALAGAGDAGVPTEPVARIEPVPPTQPVAATAPTPDPTPVSTGAVTPPAAATEEGGSKRGVLIGVGVAALVAIVAIAALLLGGGSDDDTVATAPIASETDDTDTETTVEPDPTTTEAPPDDDPAPVTTEAPLLAHDAIPCAVELDEGVCITDVSLDGDRIVVTYDTLLGLTLDPDPGALAEGTVHAHFHFNTVPAGQAGAPGAGPWEIWSATPVFDAWTVDDIPVGATQICVLVANFDHSVQPDSGNCAPLP